MALTKSKSFFQSNYALSVWVVRILLLLHGIIPIEWIKWIQSPASQSILVDPIYSLEHIREAVAVRNLFDSTAWTESYRAGSIHTPPLVLAFLEPLVTVVPSTHWQALVTGGLLIVIDYHVALNLERIGTLILYHRQYDWEESLYERMPSRIQPAMLHIFPITARRDTTTKHIMFPMEFLPILMAGIYFASPITILCSTVLVSLQNIPLLFLTSAILQAWSGSMVWSAFLLAVATYWNLHYLIFSIPLVILLRERRHSNASTVWLLAYLLGSIALQVLALLLVGQNNYVRVVTSTHGYTFAIQGLSPSLSTLWYLGMQLFQRFATYTTTLLGIAPYLLVIPLYIRLSRYPETLVRPTTLSFVMIWRMTDAKSTTHEKGEQKKERKFCWTVGRLFLSIV